jgi:hypothetical protein
MVRKSLYYNYDYYKAIGDYQFDDDEDIFKFHVSKLILSSFLSSRVSLKDFPFVANPLL